jgi:6-phosphofructo-2-kinase/fructose-2,6-biphosphatase 2
MPTSSPCLNKNYPTSAYVSDTGTHIATLTSQVPLHTLIKITPMAYGCHEERYTLPIEAVDTHRPRPAKKTGAPPSAGGEEAAKHSAASTTRDYFGDAKMFAAKPESLSQALEGVKEDTEPTVVKGQSQ